MKSIPVIKNAAHLLLPVNEANPLFRFLVANDTDLIQLIINNDLQNSKNLRESLITHGFFSLFYQRLSHIESHFEDYFQTKNAISDNLTVASNQFKQKFNHFIQQLNFPLAETQLSDAYYQHQLHHLLNDLNDLGVCPILLKGAYVSQQYYANTWLRPKSDIDIYVSEADALTIDNYFRQKNIRPYLDMNEAHTHHYQSSYPLTSLGSDKNDNINKNTTSQPLNLSVDVHRKLSHHPLFIDEFNHQDCVNNSQPFKLLPPKKQNKECVGYGLSITDSCHHAIIHLWGHHINEMRLIWLMDIKLIIERMTASEKADWIRTAEEKKILAISICTLHMIEQQFNVSLFDDAINQQLTRIENTVEIEKEPSYFLIKHGQKNALYLRFKSTQGLIKKAHWLRQHLLPSPNYMRARYQCQSNTDLIKAYFKRPLTIFKK